MFENIKNKYNTDKVVFTAMNVWVLGFFLMPFSRQHYQIFILTIVVSAFWLIFSLKINYSALIKSRVIQASFAYALFFFISIFWSNLDTLLEKSKEIKTFLYLIFFSLVFLYSLDGKSQRLIKLIHYLIVAAVLSLFINFYFFYGINNEPVSARFAGLGRLWNPLWAAAMYGGMALITLSILLDKYSELKSSIKLTLVLSYLLLVIAVFLTQSRTPIAAVVVLSFIIFFLSERTIKTKSIVTGVGIVICVAISIYLLPVIYEYTVTRGQSYRLDLWLGFFERAKEHLIFGHGGGSNVPIYAPGKFVHEWRHYHSTYIGSLVEMGLVGLTLHFIIIATVLKIAWNLRANFYVKTSGLLFIYTCIIGLTFGHGILTRMNTQWLLFWMPLLIIAMYEIRNNKMSVRNGSSEFTLDN